MADRFLFDSKSFDRLTHYVFRYPAKFHPPVARALIQTYTEPGDHILDLFCGSSTLLVEAAVCGRHGTGTDVDPVAVFVSQVKTHRFNLNHLRKSCERFHLVLKNYVRDDKEYEVRQFNDLTEQEFQETISEQVLWLPPIPNLLHWFRRYVIIDLAQIHHAILDFDAPKTHKNFLLLCFCSIIRNASNADPVPVSGLEVTSHMKRRDAAGRVVNPFTMFQKAVESNFLAVSEFREKIGDNVRVKVFQGDATQVSSRIHSPVDVVITSPPYNNAVDYYRRHKLEMYWLGLTESRKERLSLLQQYIGRPNVAARHPLVSQEEIISPIATTWESRIREHSPKRANAFKHYVVSMKRVMEEVAHILPPDKLAVFVVGHSKWRQQEIPTTDLLLELSENRFELSDRLWYPVKNRYMSYQRHNDANIDKEYVLVLRRRAP